MHRQPPNKSPATWVLVANDTSAFVLVNAGAGMGLVRNTRRYWRASQPCPPPPAKAGCGTQTDPPFVNPCADHSKAAVSFAGAINAHLYGDFEAGRFSRLAIVAGIHTLHRLRAALDPRLRDCLIGVVCKELTEQSLDVIEAAASHLLAP